MENVEVLSSSHLNSEIEKNDVVFSMDQTSPFKPTPADHEQHL